MWKYFIVLILVSFSYAAQAQDDIPTEENWQSLNPERCEPDPGDNLSLTPLIFPPTFKTEIEQLPVLDPASETIFVPEGTLKSGKIMPALIVKRVLPDMRHPKTIRKFESQYLGFLDQDGNLVDENGHAITADNPLTAKSYDDLPQSRILWERQAEEKVPIFTDLSDIKQRCRYHIEPAIRERRLQRHRSYHRREKYICKERGGYTLAPIETIDKLRHNLVKIRETRVMIWDHNGEYYSGATEELAEQFNALSKSGQCHWKKVKITP